MPRKSLVVALAAALCMTLFPGNASGQAAVSTSLRIWKIAGVGPGGPVYKVLIFGKLSSPNAQCPNGKTVQITLGGSVKNDVTDSEGEFFAGFRLTGRSSAVVRFLGTTSPPYPPTGVTSCGASTSNTVNVKPPRANRG